MFHVSWGELAVATGLGLFLIGRRDLPKAAHVVGTQVGRVVGFLQGARARADSFTQTEELRQLQAELRQGLRELDAVQSELAVSMSMSRSLHQQQQPQQLQQLQMHAPIKSQQSALPSTMRQGTTETTTMTTTAHTAATRLGEDASSTVPSRTSAIGSSRGDDNNNNDSLLVPSSSSSSSSSTHHQSLAAVAEQEWKRRGMEFISRAERQQQQQQGYYSKAAANHQQQQQHPHYKTGSVLLASVIQDSLIHDQYDRVVREQEQALQNKMAQKMQEKQRDLDNKKKEK